jgi:hypothetical protein
MLWSFRLPFSSDLYFSGFVFPTGFVFSKGIAKKIVSVCYLNHFKNTIVCNLVSQQDCISIFEMPETPNY